MTAETLRFVPSVVAPPSPPDDALWFAFADMELLVRVDDARVVSVPRGAQPPIAPVRTQYLGTLDGRACYAAELATPPSPPEGHQLYSLRRLYDKLDRAEFELAGTAFQVQYWDAHHRFCPVCATPLEARERERAKRCPRCGETLFPRIAPCAIVLVHDGPRVLLTRAPRFPPGMYGLVAGFLEPGETLEQCAAREVREETGLAIDQVRYYGSQPWPFPHQIMVGFTARHAGGELQVDHDELEEARWFAHDAMPQLPPRLSIARALIDAWLAEQG